MRTYRHSSGVQSVAYGPDGTLFALTARGGELWAYPASGAARVLAARATDSNRLEGWLDVSPNGHWLSVSGFHSPTLFKVGALASGGAAGAGPDLPLLGWERHQFPEFAFFWRTCFTGDSAYWVGRTLVGGSRAEHQFRYWRLPDLTSSVYTRFPESDCQAMASIPGTSYLVTGSRWAEYRGGDSFWRGDLSRPDDPVTTPVGTGRHYHWFQIGSDGRFFVSWDKEARIYSAGPGGLHLDLTVPLPHCTSAPQLSLAADARRFVVHCSLNKLVCAVEVGTGEVIGPWDWGVGQVNDAAIAPDGLTAAAAGSSKKLVVWDLDR